MPSENKRDEIGALALGAKLEKALARRMSGQDASFRVKKSGKGVKGEKKEVVGKTVEAPA